MIHARNLPNRILVVGQDETALALEQSSSLPAKKQQLADLVPHVMEIAKQHPLVLFKTDANEADLKALSACVEIAGERTYFVALTDDDLPLARARTLSEAGAAEVLPIGLSDEALVDALQLVLARKNESGATEQSRDGSIISVAQTRGGAGATTVAVNIAVTMASDHKRKEIGPKVALIDLDLQFGNVGTYFDVEDNGGLLSLISRDTLPERSQILNSVQSTGYGVDVITAPRVFAPLTSVSPDLVGAILETLRSAYDVVIVDLPHAMLDWVAPVIAASDRLLVVSDGSVPCIRQAKRMVDLYRETQIAVPVDLVMNRETKPLFGSDTQKTAEDLIGIKSTFWISERRAVERTSVDLGQPSASKRGKTRKNYLQIGRTLSQPANTAANNIE